MLYFLQYGFILELLSMGETMRNPEEFTFESQASGKTPDEAVSESRTRDALSGLFDEAKSEEAARAERGKDLGAMIQNTVDAEAIRNGSPENQAARAEDLRMNARAEQQVTAALSRLRKGEEVRIEDLQNIDLYLGNQTTSEKVADAMMDPIAFNDKLKSSLQEAKKMYGAIDGGDGKMVAGIDKLLNSLP